MRGCWHWWRGRHRHFQEGREAGLVCEYCCEKRRKARAQEVDAL